MLSADRDIIVSRTYLFETPGRGAPNQDLSGQTGTYGSLGIEISRNYCYEINGTSISFMYIICIVYHSTCNESSATLYCSCRSGKYTYKPTMSVTCCPMYPIRCAVANLRLTKSQKKVIKQVNQYLSYDRRHVDEASTDPQCDDDRGHSYETFSPGAEAAGKVQLTEVHSRTADNTQKSGGGAIDELPVKPTPKEVTSNLPKTGEKLIS